MDFKRFRLRNYLAIPDLASILNLIFGFLAILMFINEDILTGVKFMFISLMFDSIDGWIARKIVREDLNGFGKNIDSLCDVVSFAVAPALMLFFLGKNYNIQYINILICLIIVSCGVLRLARFNVLPNNEELSNKFVGIPIPTTILLISSFYLTGIFNFEIAIVLMFLISLLMVSNFQYPKPTDLRIILLIAVLIILSCFPDIFTIFEINLFAMILFLMILSYMIVTPLKSLL